jgi:LacI family transcriptional regulator
MNKKQQPSSGVSTYQKPATIKHVAALAGFSVATVSRVLSGGENVSEDAIKRVRKAVDSLNYQPNRNARDLRMQKSHTVALIVTDIENPFFTSGVRGVNQVLRSAGYSLLLTNSDEDEKIELEHLHNLRAEGVAGVILAPTNSDASVYEQLIQEGIILVAIDRFPKNVNIDRVTVSNISGVQAAVDHLVHLGHSRIGFISGLNRISTTQERYQGFVQGMNHHRLPIQAEWVHEGNFLREGGYSAMLKLLNLAERPTAVICANNMMSIGALQAIYEKKLVIPDDISIVGFDDMVWSTALHPPLTVISQPIQELGIEAARLLIDRIQNPGLACRHVTLDTRLIVRESSGPPPQYIG